jgi:hypothetical protein
VPIVSAEDACKEAASSVPFDICMSKLAAQGARIREVESQCTKAFPNDVALNTECREFCWARTDEPTSCAIEATIWSTNRREFEEAQRNQLIGVASVLIIIVAMIAILAFKKTRSAVGQNIARSIYAMFGWDIRRISQRWNSYRAPQRNDVSPQIKSSGAAVPSASPTTDSNKTRPKSGSVVVLLNIGRVLMWLWIISGVGHLVIGPDILGAIQQPYYMFACILQIIAAITFLILMTRALRRRAHALAQLQPKTGDKE